MDRFLKYTMGQEPVVTVNLAAALILGAIVTVTERLGVYAWDEMSLGLAGFGALIAASWLARRGVFSPATHEADVKTALYTPVPDDAP